MSDERNLIAAIQSLPNDFTVRLAYADHVEEQDRPRINCPACGKSGKVGHRHRHGTHGPGYYPCETCDETGEVADPYNRDWADLIRTQCEAERLRLVSEDDSKQLQWASELFTKHPEWSVIPCRKCAGVGWREPIPDSWQSWHPPVCGACQGAKELLRQYVEVDEPTSMVFSEPRPHGWAMGFIDWVSMRPSEVWRYKLAQASGGRTHFQFDDYKPTELTRQVLEDMPGLREIRVTGYTPGVYSDEPAVWHRDMSDLLDVEPPSGPHANVLPPAIFDMLEGGSEGGWYFAINKLSDRRYPDTRSALADLHRTVLRWARKETRG